MPAEIEHGDPVGEVTHHAKVVRDEDVADLLLRCRSASRLRIAACTETSSAEVGSSQTTMRGSPAKARAMATRCFRPPESWRGLTREIAVGQPHRARSARRARACSAAPLRPASRFKARPIRWRTECDAVERRSPGFWKTICIALTWSSLRALAAAAPAACRRARCVPPASGGTRPSSSRAKVVLPLPDSPTRPSVSPGRRARATHRCSARSAWPPSRIGLGQIRRRAAPAPRPLCAPAPRTSARRRARQRRRRVRDSGSATAGRRDR